MGAGEHRIGRVVFDIAAPDHAALTEFGDILRAGFEAVIEPALQAALDRIAPGDALVRLGRVEVALGSFAAGPPSASDLSKRIATGIAVALNSVSGGGRERVSPEQDAAAELATFLESGEMAWPDPGGALAALVAALLALDEAGMVRVAMRLRMVLIRRRAAERLARQLPPEFLRRLLLAMLPGELSAPLGAAFVVGAASGSARSVAEALVPALADAVRRIARGTDMPELGALAVLFAALSGNTAGLTALPMNAPSVSITMDPNDHEVPAPGPGVVRPIHAAGAVLLHPFLAPFFDRLGLLTALGEFRDHAARQRAVLLAHYLATGADDVPEPETPLFKLLCGMDFAEPVPRRLDPTDTERTEAEALLASVITHWQRLGRTSPAGLRDGFLTRPGRLDRRGDAWRLIVERRGTDILLDDLPWTLSRVRTPFMRGILTVDWR